MQFWWAVDGFKFITSKHYESARIASSWGGGGGGICDCIYVRKTP